MQPLHLRALFQRDTGTYLDTVTAPQPLGPLGPMALDHPMTTEIQVVDLIHLQALEVNRHQVPFYYDSHASNASLGLRSGSIALWKSQTFQHITGQPGSTVMQVPYRPDSFLKQEPSARNSWLDIKMMLSLVRLTAYSVLPRQLSWFAIPSHLKTGKLDGNLCNCGEPLPSSKFSSLMEMTEVHSLSQHLMPVHKFSALRIVEMAVENLCSNLLPVEVDSYSLLLHLTCVFLVILMKFCSGLSLKPARTGVS